MPARLPHLSLREVAVLSAAARGETVKAIAAELGMAPGTVKGHLETARGKLHAATTTQAVVIALEMGMIGPDRL